MKNIKTLCILVLATITFSINAIGQTVSTDLTQNKLNLTIDLPENLTVKQRGEMARVEIAFDDYGMYKMGIMLAPYDGISTVQEAVAARKAEMKYDENSSYVKDEENGYIIKRGSGHDLFYYVQSGGVIYQISGVLVSKQEILDSMYAAAKSAKSTIVPATEDQMESDKKKDRNRKIAKGAVAGGKAAKGLMKK